MSAVAIPATSVSISITPSSRGKRQGASADKLHVKAAKIRPLVGLVRSKQDPVNRVGTVLNDFTAPHQPGATSHSPPTGISASAGSLLKYRLAAREKYNCGRLAYCKSWRVVTCWEGVGQNSTWWLQARQCCCHLLRLQTCWQEGTGARRRRLPGHAST